MREAQLSSPMSSTMDGYFAFAMFDKGHNRVHHRWGVAHASLVAVNKGFRNVTAPQQQCRASPRAAASLSLLPLQQRPASSSPNLMQFPSVPHVVCLSIASETQRPHL